MNNLQILNENGKLVVSSREVSENFGKRHDNVVLKINSIITSWTKDTALKNKVSKYFIEDNYKDESGKSNKQYLLSRDGFSFVVMGFTGRVADVWKTKYIEAFNEMERTLISGQTLLSPKEQLKLQLKILEEQDKKIDGVSSRLTKVENTMTIDYSQQEELRTIANIKVIETLGGKDAPAYKECSKKAFSELWKAFKRVMQVNSYRNTSAKEYEDAKNALKIWEPNKDLKLMILGANSQMKINL